MKVSVCKCKIMRIGVKNPNFTHMLMEPDQVTDSSLKVFTQCPAAVEKANSMLAIIKKWIGNKMASQPAQ